MSIDVKTSRKQLLEEQKKQQDYFTIAWNVFKRKWWLIFIVLFIAVGFTYYYSKVPEGPYMATALIRPVMSGGGMFNVALGGYFGGSAGAMTMETEFEIIKGKIVIEKVINKLGITELYRKPVEKKQRKKQSDETSEPPTYSLPPELKKRFLISEIQSRLEVGWQETMASRRINLVKITARSYSPKEAMEIANTTAEAYIEVYNSYKQVAWKSMIDLLEIELKKSQVSVEESRNRLYQSANEKELAASFSGILGGIGYAPSDLPIGISSLKSRIMEMEIQLEVLRKDYSELDPRVTSLKKELDEIRQRLTKEEAKAKEKFSEQYGMSKLSSQVLFDQQMYNSLMSSHQQLKAQYLMEKQSPEIIEQAEIPLSPSSPSRRTNLSLAVVMGFVLGIVLSLFAEFLDTSMRDVGDVAKQTGIPVIGKIPRLRGMKNKPGSDMLITYKDENSSRKSWIRKAYKESYRVLQFGALAAINEDNNISLLKEMNSNHRGIALMITSAEPDEGKSTIAANLAISIAQTGRKVLLVDSDSRQPRQHTFFGIDPENITKLRDVLTEKATPEEAYIKSLVDNLYLIVSGNKDTQVDSTALLSSPKMQDFVDMLKDEFDVIILDSPAASIASESTAMGAMANGVIIVIRNSSTKKNAILQTKEMIHYSGGNILGAVLNFSKAEKIDSKYY